MPDILPLVVLPNLTSVAASFSSGPVAWITTLLPTFRSFRAAGDPLFWNFVAALTVTVTSFFDVVSTVMELSEMLVTVPITCFSFPWANVIAESANIRANTASVRFIVPFLKDVAVIFVLGFACGAHHSRTGLLLAPPLSRLDLSD